MKDTVVEVWIQSVDCDEGPSVSFCLLLSCFHGEELVLSCPPIPFTLLAGTVFIGEDEFGDGTEYAQFHSSTGTHRSILRLRLLASVWVGKPV